MANRLHRRLRRLLPSFRARGQIQKVSASSSRTKDRQLLSPANELRRVLQRREAVRMYERTDPRFGKSEFDKFRLKIVEAAEQTGEWWVYIDPFGMEREIMEVEELE